VIPDAAVEAAARALLVMFGPSSATLEDLNAEDRAEELAAARRILEAAAPHLIQAAKAEAWDEGSVDGHLYGIKAKNPYR